MSTSSDHVSFFAAGRPKTKGSMKFVRSASTGKPVPKSNPQLESWQGVVACAAFNAGCKRIPDGVDVDVRFFFVRPKSHYGTGRNANTLKAKSPRLPTSRGCGDIDKLLRAVLDGLTGVAFSDDSEVTGIAATKRYRSLLDHSPEGAHITLRKAA